MTVGVGVPYVVVSIFGVTVANVSGCFVVVVVGSSTDFVGVIYVSYIAFTYVVYVIIHRCVVYIERCYVVDVDNRVVDMLLLACVYIFVASCLVVGICGSIVGVIVVGIVLTSGYVICCISYFDIIVAARVT